MMTQNQRLGLILAAVGAILLVPFVAMQFTNEVNWSISDFVIGAVLLGTTGITCEIILRKVKKRNHRILICGVVLFTLLLVWVEMAVGIFGTPFAGS